MKLRTGDIIERDRKQYLHVRGKGSKEPLTESGVQQMVRNTARLAGLERRVYPHLLRDSFATYQLTRGMNPIQLAEILGHSSLIMIQRVYAHLSPSDAYDAMLRTLTSVGA